MRYQLRHSPLRRQRYTTGPGASHRGRVDQLPARAVCSQSESETSILRPPTAIVGVPNWPSVCSAGFAAAASVAAVIAAALPLPSTHCVNAGPAPSSVPIADSWAAVRPALPSAGCSANRRSWKAGQMPAGTAHSAAFAASVE